MSETDETLEELAKKKLKQQNNDIDQIKRERDEYRSVIELQAEKEFERELSDILDKVPESKKEQIKEYIGDDPDRLEATRAALLLNFGDPEPEPAQKSRPTGKAPLPTKPRTEYIDDVFNIATNTTAPKASRDLAKSKIDELWKHFQNNPEAKEAIKKSLQNQQSFVMNCPECGSLMYGRRCPNCDYYTQEKGGL